MRRRQFVVPEHSASRDLRFFTKIREPSDRVLLLWFAGLHLMFLSDPVVELVHRASGKGQLSSVSSVLRFVTAMIISLCHMIFCWLVIPRFIKLSPVWGSQKRKRLHWETGTAGGGRGWGVMNEKQLRCVFWLKYAACLLFFVIGRAPRLIYYPNFLTLWVTYHTAAKVGNILTPPSMMENRHNVSYK